MLREIPRIRQIDGEPQRRWFTSEHVELLVWINSTDQPIGFQLCHRDGGAEHAFTWQQSGELSYRSVDTGESTGMGPKSTPILRANGKADLSMLKQLFERVAANVPRVMHDFVLVALIGPVAP